MGGGKKIGSVGSVGSFSLVENTNKKDRGDGGRKEGVFRGTRHLCLNKDKRADISPFCADSRNFLA